MMHVEIFHENHYLDRRLLQKPRGKQNIIFRTQDTANKEVSELGGWGDSQDTALEKVAEMRGRQENQ